MNKTKPGNLFWPVFCILAFSFSPTIASPDQTVQTNLAITVRHAPRLNGGTVQGSLQQLTGESVNVHSSFAMTGDLLAPGTPTLVVRGKPTYAGTIAGDGSTSPSGYKVTISGKSSLRYLRTRTKSVSLPTVPLPSPPKGTRTVHINSRQDSSLDFIQELLPQHKTGREIVEPSQAAIL